MLVEILRHEIEYNVQNITIMESITIKKETCIYKHKRTKMAENKHKGRTIFYAFEVRDGAKRTKTKAIEVNKW